MLVSGLTVMADVTAAEFPGGKDALENYVSENMQYPPQARDNGIEGVVNVSVTIKADGSVGAIKIDRMVDPDLEQEAIRIVKGMPKWTPANDSGVAVESTVEVPVVFMLSE